MAPLAPGRGDPELVKYLARTISAALGQEGRAYYLGMACGVTPQGDPSKIYWSSSLMIKVGSLVRRNATVSSAAQTITTASIV